MARLMDDEELARTVIGGFLEDIPQQIESLQDALQAGDASGVQRQAHTIKGASGNMGGKRLQAVALDMEQAAKDGALGSAKALAGELGIQFEQIKQAMRAPW